MYYHDYTYYAAQSLDVFDVVAWGILALAVYSVVSLWRGMRQDAFERSIRTLQQQPDAVGIFSNQPQRAAPRPNSGWLQISLLPLMLLSCGMAMLLAQAQRPDEVSRPATWAVFVIAGTWYGSRTWSHRRGIGPLRNHSLAGVVTAMAVSFALWTFYFVVDYCWGDNGFHRVTSSFAVLLWWTALGGLAGGIIGTFQASRWYARLRVQSDPASTATEPLPVSARPRDRRTRWSPIILACLASLLVHASAAPHIHRAVKARYWWHWDARQPWRHDSSNAGVSLTMTPVSSNSVPREWWVSTPPIKNSLLVDSATTGSSQKESLVIETFPFPGAMPASVTNTTQSSAIVLNRDLAVGEQINASDLREVIVTDSSQDAMVGVVRNTKEIVGSVARTPLKGGAFINSSQVVFINDGSNNIQVIDLDQRVPSTEELRGIFSSPPPAMTTETATAKGSVEGSVTELVRGPVKGPEGLIKEALPETAFNNVYDGPILLTPNVSGRGAIYDFENLEGWEVTVTLKDGLVVTGRLTEFKVNEQLVLRTLNEKKGGKPTYTFTTIKWAAVDKFAVLNESVKGALGPPVTWSRPPSAGAAERTTVTPQPPPRQNQAPAATPAEPSDIPLPVGDFDVPDILVNDPEGETTEAGASPDKRPVRFYSTY